MSDEGAAVTVDRGAEVMSLRLTRKQGLVLAALSVGTIAGGLVVAYAFSDSLWIARSGALLTAFSIAHAAYALSYSRMVPRIRSVVIDVWTEIEQGRTPAADRSEAASRASARVDRVLPTLFDAVARRLAAQHLMVAAIGTLVWGFGDLFPVV